MALIVETGAGLSNAESYVSVANADTYHSNRGNTTWADLLEAEKEQALRRATDYMEQVYSERWAGLIVLSTQALSWPRYEVPQKDVAAFSAAYWPSDAVPQIVANACAEMALRASAGDLSPDIGRLKSRTKVGPLEVEYVAGGLPYVRYRAIDGMLSPFFGGGGGTTSVGVVRV